MITLFKSLVKNPVAALCLLGLLLLGGLLCRINPYTNGALFFLGGIITAVLSGLLVVEVTDRN
jgi:hypothetical protein